MSNTLLSLKLLKIRQEKLTWEKYLEMCFLNYLIQIDIDELGDWARVNP